MRQPSHLFLSGAGVTDRFGHFVDGDGDGRAGGDAVVELDPSSRK
jgi:hypothetical protein